jgi:threonine synthase
MKTSQGRELTPVHAETRASAIRIGHPASWRKAVRVLEQTNGYCEQVSEAEIAIAKAEIGREGVGCEPASAVTLAGLRKLIADGRVTRTDNVLLLLTGHALKDSEYTLDFHRGQLLAEAELRGHERALEPLRSEMPVLDASADAVLQALEAGVRR